MQKQVLKQSLVFWKGLEQADTAAMRSVCDDKCFLRPPLTIQRLQ